MISGKTQEELKGIKETFDITLDEIGKATVDVSIKLNAAQWDMYKRNTGNNTSILKRAMETSLPKYYLTDFKYTEDQMARSYNLKFNMAGLTTVDANGKWEGQLDSKDPDVTKLSEREFVINYNLMNEGMLFQVTQKIHLPSSAKNAKIEKDSFGKAILTYSTGSGMINKIIMGVGIILILGGGWLFYRSKTNARSRFHVVKKEEALAS
jgi:hypothetical protein